MSSVVTFWRMVLFKAALSGSGTSWWEAPLYYEIKLRRIWEEFRNQ